MARLLSLDFLIGGARSFALLNDVFRKEGRTMETLNTLVVYPVKEMLAKIASFIPTLGSALLILSIGWVIAKVIKDVAHKLLKTIRFDAIVSKAGIADVLAKSGIKYTASEMIAVLTYWIVMVMVLVMTINALGLTVASQLFERLIAYIPNVVYAVFVLVSGMFLANFVSGIVYAAANNANMPKPELLGKVSKWAIVLFAVSVSLEELGIAPLLVGTTFNIFFGAVCFSLALAFGLGGKETAAKYLDDLRKKRL